MRSLKSFYGSWFYIWNHVRLLLRHITVRRAANVLLNQWEFFLRKEKLRSNPVFLKIDPSNRCQLRCPGCGQASADFRASLPKKGFLTLAEFKQLIDPIAHTTLGLSLSNLGEPLLNKEIASLIKYAHSKGIGVTISTNLSIQPQREFLKQIVASGLDKLLVSLDGASSATYKQYRIGGEYEWVTANVKMLADLKRELNSSTPEIFWKFIVFDHNRHEVSRVPAQYKEMGFDAYRIDTDRYAGEVVSFKKSRYAKKKNCFWPYSTMVIDADGTLNPCCSFAGTKWELGDVLATTDVRELWNSDIYQELRRGFSRKNYGAAMHPVCRTCFGGNARS